MRSEICVALAPANLVRQRWTHSPGIRWLLLLAGAFGAAEASAQTATKTGIGSWDDPMLWNTGSVPNLNTGVFIAADTDVVKPARARLIELDSTMKVVGDEGRLDVTNDIRIGTDFDKQGTLEVDSMADSAVQARGLSIGAVNFGTVRVRSGAVWLSQGLAVGVSRGFNPADMPDFAGSGLLEISGSASSVTAASLALGSFTSSATRMGTGEVTVSNGGKLITGSGAIVNGNLTLRGVGSSWLLFRNVNEVNPNANVLSVEGEMSVLNGATVGFDYATGRAAVYGDPSRGTRGRLTVDG